MDWVSIAAVAPRRRVAKPIQATNAPIFLIRPLNEVTKFLFQCEKSCQYKWGKAQLTAFVIVMVTTQIHQGVGLGRLSGFAVAARVAAASHC